MTFKNGNGVNWEAISKVFLIPIIGIALTVIGFFVMNKLSDIQASIEKVQVGQAGIMRDNQIQDEKINSIKSEFDSHLKLLERDRSEYEALRQDYYRRFGYISATRGGKEVILDRPMQNN